MGVYTDLPMPRTSNLPVRGATRNGQSMWTNCLSDNFKTSWELELLTSSVRSQIFKGVAVHDVTVYCHLCPKLGLVVRKSPALLRIQSSEARWSSSSKSVSQVKGYSDRKYSRLLPLVTLAFSGTRGGSPVTFVPTTQIFFLWNLWE